MADINVTEEIIEINVTEEAIVIEAPSGGYPLPASISSVFGRTGAVIATIGDYNTSLVTENTNLYFTNARARSAISLTTSGTSGAATYDSGTGVLNVPQYQGGVTSFNTRTGAISLTSADVSGALTYVPYNSSNPSGYITGITSGNVTTALGYTPVTNARTLTINGTTYDLTADRSWTIAAGVTSVFGRTGVVVASEGDYTLTQLGDVTITTPANGQVLKYNGTNWVNGTDTDTGLTSVGLSMPSAFTVTNSPLTANGTLSVTGAGIASQYIRGDGTLANFPTSGGGGSSVAYYFNSSVSQGTLGGVAYRELSKVPIIGAGTDITIATNGYIASYITDAGDPALLEIPAGNWNFEMYFNASSGGGTPSFYVQLYKYDGTTFTLISSSSAAPEGITNGTAIDLYNTALAVPLTTLTLTDRLAIRVYVNNSGRTITLHTENSHLCEVITTFTTGLTALNGLTAQVQFLATGTSGTDFNISSATATHTFNLPIASALNTGKLSSSDWSVFNNKQTALSGTGFVKISGTTISYDNSTYYLASNPSAFIALTALSAGTGISYNNTTGVITNSAPDQTVSLTNGAGISVSGTYPSFTIASTITQYTDALARASISLTTTGSSGAATYNSTTGVLNIPQYSGGGGGSISLAAIGSTPNANAATLTGTVLNLEPASASFGGVVTTGTQTFAGQKTFAPSVTAASGIARGIIFTPTLIAAANSNVLSALYISPTFTNGAFTGVSNFALNVQGSSYLNGNIGINTSQISANLEVNSGTTSAAVLNIYNKEVSFAANTLLSTLNFGTNTGGGNMLNFASINCYSVTSGSSDSGYMTFGTRVNSIIERMRITSAGLVGINTTTIGSQLQVNGNAAIGYSASTAAPTNGLVVSGIVGIGTTTTKSYSSLTVQGQIVANSNFCINSGQSLRMNMYYNSGTVTDRAMSTGYSADFILHTSTGDWQIRSTSASTSADTNITTMTTRLTIAATGAATFNSSVTSTQYRLSALNTAPATSTSTGTLGEIRIDAGAIYVCTATNTWVRALLTTF